MYGQDAGYAARFLTLETTTTLVRFTLSLRTTYNKNNTNEIEKLRGDAIIFDGYAFTLPNSK